MTDKRYETGQRQARVLMAWALTYAAIALIGFYCIATLVRQDVAVDRPAFSCENCGSQ